MEMLNWETLGSRILELTRRAVQIQREEEGDIQRGAGAPFLRLVRPDEWVNEPGNAMETETAA